MNNLMTSLVRTFVPIVVGGMLSWLALKGIEVDETLRANLIIALTTGVQFVYYLVARLIEKKFPEAGILLGIAKKPEYDK